jgi:hypothetical protein
MSLKGEYQATNVYFSEQWYAIWNEYFEMWW